MQEKIILLLKTHSKEQLRPDDSPFLAINLQEAMKIAKTTNSSLYKVEELALASGITPTRFSRNQRVLTVADQHTLHRTRVAVIGLGGLGGGVTELLARVGIGNLTLIDGDVFDETNLNRQLLSTVANIGVPKATVAGKRVQEVNPATRVTTDYEYLDADNGYSLLKDIDIAVDCLDTISARFALERSCHKRKIPMVSAAIAGKSGQATTIFPGDTGLTNLYGKESDAPKRGVEAGLGTLGYTASYMASIECAEIINLILKVESPLRNALLFTDLSDYSVEHIRTS